MRAFSGTRRGRRFRRGLLIEFRQQRVRVDGPRRIALRFLLGLELPEALVEAALAAPDHKRRNARQRRAQQQNGNPKHKGKQAGRTPFFRSERILRKSVGRSTTKRGNKPDRSITETGPVCVPAAVPFLLYYTSYTKKREKGTGKEKGKEQARSAANWREPLAGERLFFSLLPFPFSLPHSSPVSSGGALCIRTHCRSFCATSLIPRLAAASSCSVQ